MSDLKEFRRLAGLSDTVGLTLEGVEPAVARNVPKAKETEVPKEKLSKTPAPKAKAAPKKAKGAPGMERQEDVDADEDLEDLEDIEDLESIETDTPNMILDEDNETVLVSEELAELLDSMSEIMQNEGYEIEDGMDMVTFLESIEATLEEDGESINPKVVDWLKRALAQIRSEAMNIGGEPIEEEDE